MKAICLIIFLGALSGCAELPMKQCDSAVVDVDVYECKDQVSGHYWRCQKNLDLKHCQAPQ